MKYLKDIRKLRKKTPYQMFKELAEHMPGSFSLQAYLRLERTTKAAFLPFSSLIGLINHSVAHDLGSVGEVIDRILIESLNDREKAPRKKRAKCN
jgi:hypothetical protein